MAYQKLQGRIAVAVTTSDTLNIPSASTEDGNGNNGCVLYVGAGGDLKVTTVGGNDVTFVNIQDGSFLPIQVIKVFATGTTCTSILAIW